VVFVGMLTGRLPGCEAAVMDVGCVARHVNVSSGHR
jgi:hypothetical protein